MALDRRAFLSGISAVPLLGAAPLAQAAAPASGAQERRRDAFAVRLAAARFEHTQPTVRHRSNGDEDRYPNRIGNFSKALPHDGFGEVDPAAYSALLAALDAASDAAFEAIPMGGTVKLANPQAAYAFQLDAPDGAALSIRVPAALASRTLAGEAVEVYWQALMRDVAFSSYPGSPLAAAAVADLSRFPAFAGVTPETLFRGDTPGDHEGPFVSQFLLKDVPFGATTIVQRYRVPEAGDDHLTDYGEWLAVQNGQPPTGILHLDPQPRYLRNARDLGEWVHRDFSYQGFLNATLILLGYGAAALDPNNPYRTSATQGGFVTFGAAHILDLVARVGEAALKAAWFQKWLVHRRLRPEAYGGLAHLHVLQGRSYPLHRDFLDSDALARTVSATGAALLPMAYPEGCPTHPAYPAGHATIAGACATVLKAFFNEAFVIPSPVEPDAAGTALVTYSGTLTAGGELNKLASNVALGRDMAGLHWRSDGIDGIALGEAVAIRILSEYCNCHNEAFAGFSLTKFDGTTISVGHIPVA